MCGRDATRLEAAMNPETAPTVPVPVIETGNIVERLLPSIISYGLKLLGIIAILIIGRWISRRVRNALLTRSVHKNFDPTLGRFFAHLAGGAIMIGAIVACLSIFGIDTASLAAVIGGAALAIGLAFQGSLSNFAAGIMLIIFRPFRVGDRVHLGDIDGTVFEMGLFSTHVDTSDNRRVIIPNGSIFGDSIVNLSHHPVRRVDVPVGTDYDADIDETRKVLEAVAREAHPPVDGHESVVYLKELGPSSIDWEVRVWAPSTEYWVVRQLVVLAIKKALDAAKISMPFPQVDVHLDPLTPEAQSDLDARIGAARDLRVSRVKGDMPPAPKLK